MDGHSPNSEPKSRLCCSKAKEAPWGWLRECLALELVALSPRGCLVLVQVVK